jgi:hypothetical protein
LESGISNPPEEEGAGTSGGPPQRVEEEVEKMRTAWKIDSVS